MITLVSRWTLSPIAEQRFMKVFRFHSRWIVFQEGLRLFGRTEVATYLYNPDVQSSIKFLEHEVVFTFSNLEEYLSECSLGEGELIDGLPCPPWAVACKLT